MQKYEVEVKSLLGTPEMADALRAALKQIDPSCRMTSHNKQLNHYFEGGTLQSLADQVEPYLSDSANERMQDLISRAKSFSVRTRDKDGEVLLVVKASVGDDTSANGVSRMEFEEPVDMSLDELDKLVLAVGFHYQAKWSREREEYSASGISVCLDKNAGYGYLAEFEKVVDSEDALAGAREEIDALMKKVSAVELPQDRLERMFSYYNTHWQDFYGTENIFVIE